MNYTVSQAAKELNVSRQTIYIKLNKLDLQDHIVIENNIKYITHKGLEIIRESLCKQVDSKDDSNVDSKVDVNNDDNLQENLTSLNSDYINSLKDEIQYLREQLVNRDKLLENMQVLLKGEQESRKLLDEKNSEAAVTKEDPIDSIKEELQNFKKAIEDDQERRFSELDIKLAQWRENLNRADEPKGFFSRLFKK